MGSVEAESAGSNIARLQAALEFIEANLREDLAIGDVAVVGRLSKWHFQSVFHAVVGNTVKEYIRRRRLTLAMDELATTGTRILDIAIASGYESQEAFGRAFKKMFGMTPGECRDTGADRAQGLMKPRVDIAYIQRRFEGADVQEPRIIDMEERRFIGMGSNYICVLSKDRNNHIVIPALWDRYLARRGEIAARDWTDYGLCLAVPDDRPRAHDDEYHYVACAEVGADDPVPEGMEALTVAAGRYAVFTHKGSLDSLGATYRSIFGQWAPQAGLALRDAPDIEIYDKRFDPNSPESEMDIAIPVE